ncbi:hypothetical protein FQA47_023614 [Oryzias melastigma]|uniref:Uncharacterized protein n=1 Tax=Oryzias melastigma TaxID=30732 RepID=A0A834L101_ORYME|nr:hypothetical protein FQA47_023614 [Oryzias melastigma]
MSGSEDGNYNRRDRGHGSPARTKSQSKSGSQSPSQACIRSDSRSDSHSKVRSRISEAIQPAPLKFSVLLSSEEVPLSVLQPRASP